MVSTRTVTPVCLEKTSACRRNSSSEAGTKWFQLRNVSSRFWANAGGLPRATQDAIPAVAAEAPRGKYRREGPCIGHSLNSAKAMGEVLGDRESSHPPAAQTGVRVF